MQSSCTEFATDTIQPPQSPLFSEGGEPDVPFDFKGAPLTIPPTAVKGLEEKIRKPSKTPEFTQDIQYFIDNYYYTIQLDTRNIISDEQDFVRNSTLKYPNTQNGSNYTLKFIALHKHIFGENQLQLSLFFQTNGPKTKFFHLCIPVSSNPVQEGQVENPFLKAWLKPANPTSLPSGFTLNEVLDFGIRSPSKLHFTTIDYCLMLNTVFGQVNTNYTLCLYKTPLYLKLNNLPQWLASDFTMGQPPPSLDPSFSGLYMRKNFAMIFHVMYRNITLKQMGSWVGKFGVINSVKSGDTVIEPPEYKQVSTTDFLSDRPLVSAFPKPIYFKVKPLQKKTDQTEGFQNLQRSLQNVKCYPIDLANQVDDEGKIVIDEETKQPIDIFEARETVSAKDQLLSPEKTLEQQEFIENMMIYGILALGILLILVIVSAFVIYVFPGSSFATALRTIRGISKKTS